MLDKNCVFCRLIRGEIPSAKLYEDGEMLVFKDIEPKAAVHLLAVPKTHFALLSEAGKEGGAILSHMLAKIPEVAAENGLENGYRLVVNQGEAAGQSVPHLHIHMLGGEPLGW